MIAKSFGYKLLNCFTFATVGAMVKWLRLADIPAAQIVFIYGALAFAGALVWVGVTRQNPFRSSQVKWHAVRGGLAVISLWIYFTILEFIPLPTVTSISLSAPLFSTAIAMVVFGERSSWGRFGALITGLVGALVVVRPGMAGFSATSLLMFIPVIMWSVQYVVIKQLGKSESDLFQLFYLAGFLTVGMAPMMPMTWVPLSAGPLLVAIGLALLFTINTVALNRAYRHVDVGLIVPIRSTQLLFAAFWGYVLFGETMVWTDVVGSAVILLSIVWLYQTKER